MPPHRITVPVAFVRSTSWLTCDVTARVIVSIDQPCTRVWVDAIETGEWRWDCWSEERGQLVRLDDLLTAWEIDDVRQRVLHAFRSARGVRT